MFKMQCQAHPDFQDRVHPNTGFASSSVIRLCEKHSTARRAIEPAMGSGVSWALQAISRLEAHQKLTSCTAEGVDTSSQTVCCYLKRMKSDLEVLNIRILCNTLRLGTAIRGAYHG